MEGKEKGPWRSAHLSASSPGALDDPPWCVLRGPAEVECRDPGAVAFAFGPSSGERCCQHFPRGRPVSGSARVESVGHVCPVMRRKQREPRGYQSDWLALRLGEPPSLKRAFSAKARVCTGRHLSILPNLPFGYPICALLKSQRNFKNSSCGVFQETPAPGLGIKNPLSVPSPVGTEPPGFK